MNKFVKIWLTISAVYGSNVLADGTRADGSSYWQQQPKTAVELKLMQGYPLTKSRQVTSDNFEHGSYSRWSFQHMTELFPHARLEHSEKSVELERVSPAIDINTVSFIATDGKTHDISELLYKSYTDSFVVLKDGKLLNEQYFNGMKPGTPHLMMSVTKTYTAMIAGSLTEQGKLDISKQVTFYLPELKGGALEGTTVQQVLDMTAGVKYSEDYNEPKADVVIESCVFGWGTSIGCDARPNTFEQYILTLKIKDQRDGEKFHYRSVLTDVLAMLIERTSGQRLAELFSANLWQKLGTEHHGYISLDSVGFSYAAGGLSASARDVARFGQMILQQGKFNDQQIVPPGWIEEIFSENKTLKQAFADGEYAEALPGWHYHNQTWVKDAGQGVVLAIGVHGQLIYINKTAQVVIVKQSSQPAATNLAMYLDTFAGLDAIVDALNK